jgi:hypothetical protein
MEVHNARIQEDCSAVKRLAGIVEVWIIPVTAARIQKGYSPVKRLVKIAEARTIQPCFVRTKKTTVQSAF